MTTPAIPQAGHPGPASAGVGRRRTAESRRAAGRLPPASALVLAGGRSSRFAADKLEAYVGGRPLLHYALSAVSTVCRDVVVVAAPNGAGRDRASLGQLSGASVRIVHDDEAFGGPLLGVLAGVRAARHPICLVLGGDMPLLRPELLAHMLTVAGADRAVPARSVALRLDGDIQVLPMVLRRDATPAIAAMIGAGRRALRDLLEGLPFRVLEPEDWLPCDPDGISLVDIDRIEDLVRWSRLLAGAPADG